MNSQNDPRVIVALDYPNADSALYLARQLDPAQCRLKVGKELFTRSGPAVIESLTELGFSIFLDLKFHDIPNTVAGACRAAAEMGVWMVNVHATGGRRMMEAAREAIDTGPHSPKLIAVTILTSMGQEDLDEIGMNGTPLDNVSTLAALAHRSGMDGVVCSPREVTRLRQERGSDFTLVTPGIRPAGADTQDQIRITTPADAIELGSSYLVVGRPITGASDPLEALARINAEIAAV